MQMSVKDAFIVMFYAYTQIHKKNFKYIPQAIAYNVLRDKFPTFEELRSNVSQRLISDKLINAIQDHVTPLTTYISTEQFYIDCSASHKAYLKLWELYSFQEHPRSRAYCQQLVESHYMDRTCTLVDESITFERYFKDLSFPIADLTQTEYEQLCMDAINIATGSNLVTVVTLGEVQKELLHLMGELSSYPLQYLRNVSLTKFHVLGMVSTRVGDIATQSGHVHYAKVVNTEVKNLASRGEHNYGLNDANLVPEIDYDFDMKAHYKINVLTDVKDASSSRARYNVKGNALQFGNVSIRTFANPDDSGDLDQYVDPNDPQWPSTEL